MVDAIVAVEKAKRPAESPLAKRGRWAFRRPIHLERIALLAQRVSGVALFVYLFFHIFVTGTIVSGREAWEGVMATLAHPLARVGELLVVVGATFHAVNGIRVMLLELTPLVGRPARPDYPYEARSLGTAQRSVLYAAMVMSSLSLIAGVLLLWGA